MATSPIYFMLLSHWPGDTGEEVPLLLERRSPCKLARPWLRARQTRLGRRPLEDPFAAPILKRSLAMPVFFIVYVFFFSLFFHQFLQRTRVDLFIMDPTIYFLYTGTTGLPWWGFFSFLFFLCVSCNAYSMPFTLMLVFSRIFCGVFFSFFS